MHEHNYEVIKDDGIKLTYQCSVCLDTYTEEKNPKVTLVDKIKKLLGGD